MPAGIRITDLDLGNNITHLGTDFQISTSALFETGTIVAESIDDPINLTSIMFDIILDPTIEYYARTRVRLSTGYTIWGNVDIFTPKDINDVELDMDPPSKVPPPTLTTTGDVNNFPLALFTLSVSGFSSVGTATHESTTWSIETLDGIVVWMVVKDIINKTTIDVNSVILEPGKVYRIKAAMSNSSNDVSQYATTTVTTQGSALIDILTPLTNVSPTVDLTIIINNTIGNTATSWELYSLGDFGSELLINTVNTVDLTTLVIPATDLKINTSYMLKVKTSVDVVWEYISFSTY